MERRNFAQILKEAKINYKREYQRLYAFFFEMPINQEENVLRDACANAFWNMPIRGTCLTLDDFDESHKIKFEKEPKKCDLNYLLNFCEYTYNLVYHVAFGAWNYGFHTPREKFIDQVHRVAELMGYMFSSSENGIWILVPKDQSAIAVSETVDKCLSYKVIEYNHHSMKGCIERKKGILLALADKLESNRRKLKQINSVMEDQLFFLFNTLNIRHNNIAPESKQYKKYVANMDKDALEKWYDETYQLSLLAFMELDNLDRKNKIKKLKDDIGNC